MDKSTKTILVWPRFSNCCHCYFRLWVFYFFFKLLQFQCNCYAYSPPKIYPYKTYKAYTFLMQRFPILCNAILKYFVNSKHMFTLNINLIHIYQTHEIHTNILKILKNLHFLFFYVDILLKISYHFSQLVKKVLIYKYLIFNILQFLVLLIKYINSLQQLIYTNNK